MIIQMDGFGGISSYVVANCVVKEADTLPGFTLVEVMISFVIFTMVVSGADLWLRGREPAGGVEFHVAGGPVFRLARRGTRPRGQLAAAGLSADERAGNDGRAAALR